MKNHTFWVIPYVLHSLILGFTLAPFLTISLFTNHLLATRHYIAELAKCDRRLERPRPRTPRSANAKSSFRTSKYTKYRRRSFKNKFISTQHFGRQRPLNTYAMTPALKDRALKDRTATGLYGCISPRVQFGIQQLILPYACCLGFRFRVHFHFCLHNYYLSTLGISNYTMKGCVYKRNLFRRFLSAKPLKSADSADWLPDKNLVKTLRSKKRDIPHLKPKKATRSRLKKASMEKFKCEKRNRKLTRKAKRARVKFITDFDQVI